MKKKLQRFMPFAALIAIGFSAGGCSGFHDVALNKNEKIDFHTMGLLSIHRPARLDIAMPKTGSIVTGAVTFGALGGVLTEGLESDELNAESRAFTQLARDRGYSVTRQLTQTLKSDLEKAGYRVKIIKVQRKDDDFVEQYPSVEAVGAYLDVVIEDGKAGYRADGVFDAYYPYLLVAVRLVRASDKRIIYARQTVYGPSGLPIGLNLIQPARVYRFSNFDAIMKSPDRAIQGLETAVDRVAQRITEDIR